MYASEIIGQKLVVAGADATTTTRKSRLTMPWL